MKSQKVIRIAIPTAEGRLCNHFGHCKEFAIINADTENKTVLDTKFLTPPPHEPGILPKWIAENGVNLVIAGGMGQRAQALFNEQNIEVVAGAAEDEAVEIVKSWLGGTLITGANACDH